MGCGVSYLWVQSYFDFIIKINVLKWVVCIFDVEIALGIQKLGIYLDDRIPLDFKLLKKINFKSC